MGKLNLTKLLRPWTIDPDELSGSTPWEQYDAHMNTNNGNMTLGDADVETLWRQIGVDTIQISGLFIQGAETAYTNGYFVFGFPPGYWGDLTKTPLQSGNCPSNAFITNSATSDTYVGAASIKNQNDEGGIADQIVIGVQGTLGFVPLSDNPFDFSAGDILYFSITCPFTTEAPPEP